MMSTHPSTSLPWTRGVLQCVLFTVLELSFLHLFSVSGGVWPILADKMHATMKQRKSVPFGCESARCSRSAWLFPEGLHATARPSQRTAVPLSAHPHVMCFIRLNRCCLTTLKSTLVCLQSSWLYVNDILVIRVSKTLKNMFLKIKNTNPRRFQALLYPKLEDGSWPEHVGVCYSWLLSTNPLLPDCKTHTERAKNRGYGIKVKRETRVTRHGGCFLQLINHWSGVQVIKVGDDEGDF